MKNVVIVEMIGEDARSEWRVTLNKTAQGTIGVSVLRHDKGDYWDLIAAKTVQAEDIQKLVGGERG